MLISAIKKFNTLTKYRQAATVCVLLCFFFKTNAQHISGFVSDSSSKESLAGVLVTDSLGKFLTYTNERGYFHLPQNNTKTLRFTLIGYRSNVVRLSPSNLNQTVLLSFLNNVLEEVTIKETYRDNYEDNITKLSAKDIKLYPSLMGEKDLIKVVQTLPGVKRIIEGGSGFSVRGGGADQNLVMLDNVPIYSYNHVFGLFSMFNTDAVKDIEFIKNGIPARYGGRSSSVLNIRLKDGNLEKWQGDASIGLLSSKFSFNGPLIKNKTAILVSARRSYIDLVTKPFMPKTNQQAYFLEDYGLKISHKINTNSRIFGGFYFSNDNYRENNKQIYSPTLSVSSPFRFGWKNTLGYLQYAHSKANVFTSIQGYTSRYHFDYFETTEKQSLTQTVRLSQLDFDSYIFDTGININQDRILSSKQTLRVGLGTLNRSFFPKSVNQILSEDEQTFITKSNSIKSPNNFEGYVFSDFKQQWSKRISSTFGLRGVFFYSEKPNYFLEPRLSVTAQINASQTLRLGYHKINQFVHLLSNSGGALPTDMWVTASKIIKPQTSEQLSLGYSKTTSLAKNNFQFEADLYYKKMTNLLNFKSGANLLNITEGFEDSQIQSRWEDAVTNGHGYAYGLELYLKKTTGKVPFTISYTLSKSRYQFDKLNDSKWFYPKFDRLHDFNMNVSYPVNKKIVVNGAFLFGTGNPVTLPNYLYPTDNIYSNMKRGTMSEETPHYASINNYRSDAYHRLDLGVSFNKKKKKFTRTWEASIFNVYAQTNPFYYSIKKINTDIFGSSSFEPQKKHYLTIIPSVSYAISF